MIKIEKLTKSYPGASSPALNNVSLTIPQGEIFGILGRSGAGKSTLLRSLNLLERPSSGHIWIDGQDITALAPGQLRRQRQQMGMIFQHFNLLHSRTVAENIQLSLDIAGIPAARRRLRVVQLLERVGLADKANAWPSQLSGGQKQRVGIARALAAEPRYLLCDEATSALDPETTLAILDLLVELQQDLAITVVVITHDMAVVKRVCHGAALLDKGELIESGSLANIMANPRSSLRQLLIEDGETERIFMQKYSVGQTKCVA
ncbi:methionine ABC transporter ATP-binding protein [Erwinia phyllosphaerae]|uniref:methionine ABC transporter ATP-binding protein n=1 Tax=Erwinia phyllosphaerae TaxID=2853256 RepID=UPI001FEFD43B|nr:ATP-binding cassette domain-containing protein [Erwinia phyllosphaerae]MBV4366751.1 ATP-binding cassette domain-containing protein [Erwinia phyllosphaerae]